MKFVYMYRTGFKNGGWGGGLGSGPSLKMGAFRVATHKKSGISELKVTENVYFLKTRVVLI